MPLQKSRLLRGYSLDPGFSTRLDTASINEITYKVRWEDDLEKGPCGAYYDIIDYDPASNCFYDPVDLNSIEVLMQNGLSPSEGNPKFHQQFIYAVAMQTLEYFEHSLGRKVIWSPRTIYKKVRGRKDPVSEKIYVDKLRIYPHAFREPNAYYIPEKKSVVFGYFEAAQKVQGENVPGGVIFSCLSPDIVSHEITHAILDSIHTRFLENTNPDVAAFHEGFADIVALLQRFTVSSLVEHQIAKTRGNLAEFSFLGELATQFGNALQFSRGALRGAIGKFNEKEQKWEKHKPDPQVYQTQFEPHERGAILVAAVFEAFLRLYNNTTEDLIRIASNGTGILEPGAIHPDLVKRLANTVCEIAEHLLHICIRALDYCPPNDINFGDFFRALITADLDSSPADKSGYRLALIEAFRCWGIFPDRVNTLSIESLCWTKPDELTKKEKDVLGYVARFLKDEVRKIVDLSTLDTDNREEIYNESQRVQAVLHDLLIRTKKPILGTEVWSGFLNKIGLTDKPVSFTYEGETFKSTTVPLIEVHKLRTANRVGREGNLLEQVVITLSQTFRINSGTLAGAKFRGGCTLILNMSKNYDVEYIIYKSINSQSRFTYQMDYQTGKNPAFVPLSDSMYEDERGFNSLDFASLHFHNIT